MDWESGSSESPDPPSPSPPTPPPPPPTPIRPAPSTNSPIPSLTIGRVFEVLPRIKAGNIEAIYDFVILVQKILMLFIQSLHPT